MLVLTRKPGEKIVIGDEIVITVLRIEGNSVKIGIEAPKYVRILRAELYEELKNENIKASGVSKDDLKEVLKNDKGYKGTGPSS
ncbi:carbon storage regulator CsrA [Thermotoga sp. KOL6]|uniref:carbon storage regulator CsrA n=1 Tax=Thermotoga sp. KOL6 TaxID=126741 RepID=UPI000C759FAD|nr:carbon storage regulator CsrA [Thermotoga sp. KOL6]PLV59006.1 carbon storage regulator [Thermotoga sp. KOL6]